MKMRLLLPLCLALLSAQGSAQKQSAAPPQATPQQIAADKQQTERAVAALQPQRKGIVDGYVVVVALDTDTVFNREAREAGRVLARRFDAVGRTIVLAEDEGADRASAPGTTKDLAVALTEIAQIMDRREDVLILYTTSHGVPQQGLVYKNSKRGMALIGPDLFAMLINSLNVKNKLLMLQACYSGQFVPVLQSPSTIVVTAAADDRSSFGCQAGNDWTLFGTALINHAFRQPLPLDVQFRRATALIAAAEDRAKLLPSNPQVSIGEDTGAWVNALDEREPKDGTHPVGQPVQGLGI
jgi:hypothetical protein